MIESKSRVAIYCRLSEEDRNKQSETDDSNSIQNQKSMLLQYSLEHGWEVYNIYSDDITLVLTDDDQNLTGCWRTQRIVNLILSFVRHNPDLPEN